MLLIAVEQAGEAGGMSKRAGANVLPQRLPAAPGGCELQT